MSWAWTASRKLMSWLIKDCLGWFCYLITYATVLCHVQSTALYKPHNPLGQAVKIFIQGKRGSRTVRDFLKDKYAVINSYVTVLLETSTERPRETKIHCLWDRSGKAGPKPGKICFATPRFSAHIESICKMHTLCQALSLAWVQKMVPIISHLFHTLLILIPLPTFPLGKIKC